MTNGTWVFIDLVIVTALVSLVTKEMNLLETFILYMSKRVSLIPSFLFAISDQNPQEHKVNKTKNQTRVVPPERALLEGEGRCESQN